MVKKKTSKKKTATAAEEEGINWVAWALGIGGTLVTALIVYIAQFFAFGFEEYVKGVAATAQAVDSQQFQQVEQDIATIKQTLTTEAERDAEWRLQQQEDMRNLVRIISEQ